MTNKPRPKIESHDNGDWKASRTGEDYIFLCNPWAIIWRWTKKIEKKKSDFVFIAYYTNKRPN